MARRYVRDKAGRFASKGGGGKRRGKLSKSTAGRSARAKYKSATSSLRKTKAGFGSTAPVKGQTYGSKGHKKKIATAKGRVTRVTNKMTGKGKAAGSGLKKGLSAQAASRRKQSFRSKATKGRAAKAEYKAARRADRKTGGELAKKRVIKKQTGKPAYVTSESGRLSRDKAPRAGSKTKAQKIRAKIDSKKFANKELRGSEFKGAKKRAATKKKAAVKKKAATKAPSAFGKTAKYTRQGKVSKASGKGRAAKAKYKKVKGKARTAEKMLSPGREEGQAKAALTRLKKNKKATRGKGYGISEKGKAARQRFTQLKRERGGATKGRGTADQKAAGMSYRQSLASLGIKTKGRVPKGPSLGTKSRSQYLKEMPRKQSWEGKGSKSKRRMQNIKRRRG